MRVVPVMPVGCGTTVAGRSRVRVLAFTPPHPNQTTRENYPKPPGHKPVISQKWPRGWSAKCSPYPAKEGSKNEGQNFHFGAIAMSELEEIIKNPRATSRFSPTSCQMQKMAFLANTARHMKMNTLWPRDWKLDYFPGKTHIFQ